MIGRVLIAAGALLVCLAVTLEPPLTALWAPGLGLVLAGCSLQPAPARSTRTETR